MGSNHTPIDLYPGGRLPSIILSTEICTTPGLQSPCPNQLDGLYNCSDSTTAFCDVIHYRANNGDPGPIDFQTGGSISSYGTIQSVLDKMVFTSPNGGVIVVPNVSISLVDTGYIEYPDGSRFLPEVGTLSLGAPTFNQSWTAVSGPGLINASLIPSNLLAQGKTASYSVGLHVGSALYPNLKGSLIFGGYDQTRVLGQVGSYQVPGSGILQVDVLDIGIGVAIGDSPFNFTSKSGLLAQGNSTIQASISVRIEGGAPYMSLPRSSCDAIASFLPVTFSERYRLYLWNTNDNSYHQIVTSPAYLSFTFRSGTIVRVPFALLNLNLTAPLVDQPTPYFPCQPFDSDLYVLGRAFLQAAFLGVNWETGIGTWWLAQAPGPNTSSTPVITSIDLDAQTISPSTNIWEDTWSGIWTPLDKTINSTNTTSSPQSTTSSKRSNLSAGDKAGIGIGAAIAAVLVIIAGIMVFRCTSRRSRSQSHVAGPSTNDGVTGYEASSLDIQEMPATIGPQELPPADRWELSPSELSELPAGHNMSGAPVRTYAVRRGRTRCSRSSAV